MRNVWDQVERYVPWFLLLLGVDCFCGILLWLSDFSVFQILFPLIFLASMLLFFAIFFWINRKNAEKNKAFQAFLTSPDLCSEERLLRLISREEGKSIRLLGSVLRSQKQENGEMADALRDYEEYVEGWAHEAKTPLSLLTMLLDNRGEELDPSMREKLEYICTSLKEDITQMLYYARLKSSTKDYRMEEISVKECLEEVLEDYAPLLEEKQFVITNYIEEERVYTDRRGLQFMLGQILSNAVKYSRRKPALTISFQPGTGEDWLILKDNGIGVKKYDLPYIFQKGFTGDSTDSRKKATGMGLYLTKKMAEDLHLFLEADSVWGEGFQMKIIFKK